MSLWFGASAAAPALASRWGLAAADAGRLTLAVQLGFVAGTLVSAIANVSDVLAPRMPRSRSRRRDRAPASRCASPPASSWRASIRLA